MFLSTPMRWSMRMTLMPARSMNVLESCSPSCGGRSRCHGSVYKFCRSCWYLLKPGSETQDVGRVTVQYSNATNGWTFRAAQGSSDKGDNVNWIFPPTGTVIMVR